VSGSGAVQPVTVSRHCRVLIRTGYGKSFWIKERGGLRLLQTVRAMGTAGTPPARVKSANPTAFKSTRCESPAGCELWSKNGLRKLRNSKSRLSYPVEVEVDSVPDSETDSHR
jgi:hypothetical protein